MLIVDDFWGSREWDSFAEEIRQVLPEYPIVDIPLDHPLLHTMYDIDEILQVPNVPTGTPTWATPAYKLGINLLIYGMTH